MVGVLVGWTVTTWYAAHAKTPHVKLESLINEQKPTKFFLPIQASIAKLVAYQLGTGEVPGLDPGKGKND